MNRISKVVYSRSSCQFRSRSGSKQSGKERVTCGRRAGKKRAKEILITGKWVQFRKKKTEVVVNWLRVEHKRLTQEYLFAG